MGIQMYAAKGETAVFRIIMLGLFLAFHSPAAALQSNMDRSIANVLKSEGGNDDDKRDPGGRTSRGITQREWNKWRRTHPGRPADVWQAPQADVVAIYQMNYWQHKCVRADQLPAGVDYSLVDYAINAGVGRAGVVLRRMVGIAADKCDVTDAVLKAVSVRDPLRMIHVMAAERRQFYENLIARRPVLGAFRKGWFARADSVEAISNRMGGAPPSVGLFGEEIETEPAFGPGKAFLK